MFQIKVMQKLTAYLFPFQKTNYICQSKPTNKTHEPKNLITIIHTPAIHNNLFPTPDRRHRHRFNRCPHRRGGGYADKSGQRKCLTATDDFHRRKIQHAWRRKHADLHKLPRIQAIYKRDFQTGQRYGSS